MKPRNRRYHLNLDLNGVIVLVAVGVLLPVMLSTAVGIVALVIADDAVGIVTGVLMVSFAAAAAGSALITVVLTRRKSRLARLQADLVANVSHEFRTPLSAIRLYTQTVLSGRVADDPERSRECLQTVMRETERLDALVDRVLTWRASSKGSMPLTMETGPIGPAVEDAVERFQRMVAPDEVDFSVRLESRIQVNHDVSAISATILNLLINAHKYSAAEKRIRLEVHDVGDGVMISVEDNGIGLPASEVQRIFQPFYRVKRHDGGAIGGVGLGLTIVQHLVHRHGGTVSVESEPGAGTRFTINLPEAS